MILSNPNVKATINVNIVRVLRFRLERTLSNTCIEYNGLANINKLITPPRTTEYLKTNLHDARASPNGFTMIFSLLITLT
jgi:hypothetical protein